MTDDRIKLPYLDEKGLDEKKFITTDNGLTDLNDIQNANTRSILDH